MEARKKAAMRTKAGDALPFDAKHVDDLALPFCACGRLWSECDGSRVACRKRAALTSAVSS